MQGIAAEPAEGMHDDVLERARSGFRLGDHVLEDRDGLVQRRCPRFGIDTTTCQPAALAIGAALGDWSGSDGSRSACRAVDTRT